MLGNGKEELIPSLYVQSEPQILRLMQNTKLNNKILHEILDRITELMPGFLT